MDQPRALIAVAAGLLLMFLVFAALWVRRYVKVGSNEALIISGRPRRLADGRVVGFRIVKGGGTFVLPVIEKADVLSLELLTLGVKTPEIPTVQGVRVALEGVAQVKVKADMASIAAAAERLLGRTPGEVAMLALETLEGAFRDVASHLTVEELYTKRESFAQKVQDAANTQLAAAGMAVESLVVKEVRDSHGYLKAIGEARLAEVKRDAEIAQAKCDQEMAVVSAQHRAQAERARMEAERCVMEAQAQLVPRCAQAGCGAANLPKSNYCRMCGQPLPEKA